MNHTHCRICGRELFPEILLELKNMPAADFGDVLVMGTFFRMKSRGNLRENHI